MPPEEGSRAEQARDEAVAAAERAEAALAEMRSLAERMEMLMAAAGGDLLAFEPGAGAQWRLRNTSDRELVIERLVNRSEFVRWPFDRLPVAIAAGDCAEVTLVGAWGHPLPATMELQIQGLPRHYRMELPRDDGESPGG